MNSSRIISKIGPVFALGFVKRAMPIVGNRTVLTWVSPNQPGTRSSGCAASRYFGRRHGHAISRRPHLRR